MNNSWSFLKSAELRALSDLCIGDSFLTEDGRPGIVTCDDECEEYDALDLYTKDWMRNIARDTPVYRLRVWNGARSLGDMLRMRASRAHLTYSVKKEELHQELFEFGYTYSQLLFVLEHCTDYGFSYSLQNNLYTLKMIEEK